MALARGLKRVYSSVCGKFNGEGVLSSTGHKHVNKQQVCFFGQPAPQTHPHLFNHDEVTPGISKEEYSRRRYLLMEHIRQSELGQMHQNHIVILPSATKFFMAHDVPYPFRQNSDFWYSCGFLEPDSVLVLHSDSRNSLPSHHAILFVPKRDPYKELWEGRRSGIEGAIKLTGVDSAYNTDDLERYLELYMQQTQDFVIWYNFNKPAHVEYHFNYIQSFIHEDRHCALDSPARLFNEVRLVKTDSEIELMKKSCQIASEAIKEVMAFSYVNREESHLYAKMDFECRTNGAEMLAYPPVVAGGDRANVIHYVRNDQRVGADQMVLMDAGCQYHGYSSDITRTWPVSGTFTEAQKEVYESVQRVQEGCLKCCEGETSLDQMLRHMLELIGEELKVLGVLTPSTSGVDMLQRAREFCPHHVGHYLGMDVHDCDGVSRSRLLQPGMIFTVEPGLYFPASNKSIPERLRGIGVRIEDDILKTTCGYESLTKSCPKTVKEIEMVINKGQ